jgi:hypothetical protein
LAGNRSKKGTITIKTPVATKRPLRTPPIINPNESSKEDREGIRVSTTLPLTLETNIEVEVLAKEFWIVNIISIPGARNKL